MKDTHGRDIHTKGYTHEGTHGGTYTRRRHTYGRTYTRKEHKHEGIHTRRDTNTEGPTHGGAYT